MFFKNANTIGIARRLKVHVLATVEGIYVIGLTSKFQNIFLKMSWKCQSNIIEAIKEKFAGLEKNRRLSVDVDTVERLNKETKKILDRFIFFTSDLQLVNLLNDSKFFDGINSNCLTVGKNNFFKIKIFNLYFEKWKK